MEDQDLCIFESYRKPGRFHVSNRVWYGGPDRPDYFKLYDVTFAEAVRMVANREAIDHTRKIDTYLAGKRVDGKIRVKALSRKVS